MSKKPDGRKKGTDYEVGYGRPPKEYQWQKGTSGKPTGRPKGAKSFKTEVEQLLKRKVTVRVNGKARKASVVEANFERLLQKAMAGDPKAMGIILELARTYLPEDIKAFEELRHEDREILKRLLLSYFKLDTFETKVFVIA